MLLPPWNTPWHFDIGLTKSYDKVQIIFTKHFSSTSHFFSPLLLLLQIRHWHEASSFAQFHLGREWIEWIERIEWIECMDWIDWVEWLEWLEWLECKTPIKDDPEQRIRIQIHPLKVSTLSPRPNWNPLIWRAPPPADHTRVQGSRQNISFTTSCDIFSRYSMFTHTVQTVQTGEAVSALKMFSSPLPSRHSAQPNETTWSCAGPTPEINFGSNIDKR